MKIIQAGIEALGGIGQEIERIIRIEYANRVTNRLIGSNEVDGRDGIMFLAGMEACKALLTLDVAPMDIATEATALFYRSAVEVADKPNGEGLVETLTDVIELVCEAVDVKIDHLEEA